MKQGKFESLDELEAAIEIEEDAARKASAELARVVDRRNELYEIKRTWFRYKDKAMSTPGCIFVDKKIDKPKTKKSAEPT